MKAGDSVVFFARQDGFSSRLVCYRRNSRRYVFTFDFDRPISDYMFDGGTTFNGEAYFAADMV